MRLDAAAASALTSTTRDQQPCSRSRSKTDPMRVRDASFAEARRSANSASHTKHTSSSSQSHSHSHSHSLSHALSSNSFSNPALAGFSPRKIAALKSAAAARPGASPSSPLSPSHSSSSIPTLLLQTPRTTRDPDLLAQSPVRYNNNNNAYHGHDINDENNFTNPLLSTGTVPSAGSSTVSPSETTASSTVHPASSIDSRLSYHPKRSPASRSSLGIETSSGPPPALSTRRSLAQERLSLSSTNNTNNITTTTLDYPRRPRSFGLVSTTARDSGSRLLSPTTPTAADAGSEGERRSGGGAGGGIMKSESLFSDRKRSSLPTRAVYSSRQKERPAGSASLRMVDSAVDDDNEEHNEEEDGDLTARIESGADADASSKDSEDGRQKNEDVFLNIAQSTSARRRSMQTERQRSKFRLSGLSSRAQTSEETPPPDRNTITYDSCDTSPVSGRPLTGILKSSSSTVHPLDDYTNRHRYLGSSTARSTIGLTRNRLSRTNCESSPESPHGYASRERRGSTTTHVLDNNDVPLRGYRHSSGPRTHRALSNSEAAADRPRFDPDRSRFDGTESTLSTTAPSTVWDELDDLKSRIRKLEITGKLPASSAAAMSSINAMAAGGPGAGVVERPRTATTTVTTVSSSPKHHGRKKSTSPNAGDATAPNAADTQIQSLLRAGLEKAKATLSPQVYATLEATANDALALASVFGSNSQHQHQQHHSQLSSSGMSVLSMAAGSDRQLKRKVDNLCRSLTELCISLADEKLIALSKNRPGSRDATTAASSNLPQLNGMDPTSSNSSSTVNYRRSTSHEPDDLGRQGGSQGLNRTLAGSRLDGRRSSMLNLSTGNAVRSSQEASDSQTTIKLSSTTPATSTSRISRSSTTAGLLRQNRRQHDDEDKNNSGDRSSSSLLQRPPSRVFTDTPDSSSKPRHHTSLLTRSSRELLQSAKYQQQAQQPQQRSYLPAQPTTKFRTSNSNSNNTSNNNQQSGSAIPLRRGYLSPAIPATGSPTPSSHLHLKVQPGYRRYGSSVIDPGTTTNATTRETSPQLNDGSDVASSSPLQYTGSNGAIAGAGNGTPLTRTASHVSSMQQLRPRPRTNSFGTRRLSLRRTTMGRD